MEHLPELIERVTRAMGGIDHLSLSIDVPVFRLNAWHQKTEPCPPEMVALIADAGDYDPVAWMARAVLAKYANTARSASLEKALRWTIGSERVERMTRWSTPKALSRRGCWIYHRRVHATCQG